MTSSSLIFGNNNNVEYLAPASRQSFMHETLSMMTRESAEQAEAFRSMACMDWWNGAGPKWLDRIPTSTQEKRRMH